MIGTTFYLYTREARKARVEISRYTTLATWNATRPTKIFIHGFLDNSNKQWWFDMKNAILEVVSILLFRLFDRIWLMSIKFRKMSM